MALQAAGLGLMAGGAWAQGRAEGQLADAQAKVLEMSAIDRIVQGKEDQAALYREASRVLGSQRVIFAGGNVRLDVGAPVDAAADTVRETSLAATTIRNNARRDAWSLRMQAAGVRASGDWARKAGKLKALGTLLGGGGQMAASGG